ncbi:hypothetical protein Gotri_014555 [Gossypium trilobum]|uniref:Uncharacterized protein n=1 Tax=Gossypium trilobum TaxID=34281 RepID=A0A7J9DX48_9ROSI|nr:hypothetical protein [Gossypium trilobum]
MKRHYLQSSCASRIGYCRSLWLTI